jgi:peptide/nickel transport system permease protein
MGRALRNVALGIGLAGVLALGVVALFGPQLSSGDPQAQRIVIFYPDGAIRVPPTPPDAYYPLGTDPLGRDQLARVLWGARLTFTVVLLALLMRAALAVTLGVLAGWRGGAVDALITIATNAIAGVPQLLLALLVAVALRQNAILGFVVALGVVGWAESAQFVRGEVIRLRSAPYIDAARALGARTRGIVRRHLLRSLAPQLFGLFALEAGATLLLLAELGFLGVFMSGAIITVDDANRPILPVRDRAPEWGQMLAGAQQYAFSNQFVAFVPGVVVAAAVFAFNLLGEGARAATDPFSSLSLSPRAIGALGRTLLVVALLGGAFFGIAEARSTELSFDAALGLARDAVARVEPGDELLAAVVRYGSEAHALAKPQKYNFYFRSHGVFEIVRVGFPDLDQNAMEVRHDDEDGLDYAALQPLGTWTVTQDRAIELAEQRGGRAFRNGSRAWLVRVVLEQPPGLGGPAYRVLYSAPASPATPNVDVLVDAARDEPETAAFRFAAAGVRAQAALGGPVALVNAGAAWIATAATPAGFGVTQPTSISFTFMRSDHSNDLRTVTVGAGGSSGPPFVGTSGVRQVPLPGPVDIEAAFAEVERQGGAALREQWIRDGTTDWRVTARTMLQSGAVLVELTYFRVVEVAATFTYDAASGRVERVR